MSCFWTRRKVLRLTFPTIEAAGEARRLDGKPVMMSSNSPATLSLTTPFTDDPVHVIAFEGASLSDVR